MICDICEKEFNKNSNSQKCYSKECSKKYSKINNKEYHKEYYQENKKELKEYQKEYYQKNKEEILKRIKEYDEQQYKENKKEILKRNKEYRQTSNGKESMKKHTNRRNRNLGFNPLNEYFDGSDAHHIDEINVIYIPKKLHRVIWHSVLNNINMNEINQLAWEFLESNSY